MNPTVDHTVAQLLARTGAGRTTLRLQRDQYAVVAEALAPGAWSIRGDTSIDLTKAATVEFLKRTGTVLVQEDLEAAEPAPPRELIDLYGARAQMLGPVVQDGQLVGIISVHHLAGPREWSPADRQALEDAVAEVGADLLQRPPS